MNKSDLIAKISNDVGKSKSKAEIAINSFRRTYKKKGEDSYHKTNEIYNSKVRNDELNVIDPVFRFNF